MRFYHFVPIIGYGLGLIGEKVVKLVAVEIPHAVKIARGVVLRLEVLFGATADQPETFVKSIRTVFAVGFAACHIIASLPKALRDLPCVEL